MGAGVGIRAVLLGDADYPCVRLRGQLIPVALAKFVQTIPIELYPSFPIVGGCAGSVTRDSQCRSTAASEAMPNQPGIWPSTSHTPM
jgi:hypothetical protein